MVPNVSLLSAQLIKKDLASLLSNLAKKMDSIAKK